MIQHGCHHLVKDLKKEIRYLIDIHNTVLVMGLEVELQ